MNRRNFLRRLGVGLGVAAVGATPAILKHLLPGEERWPTIKVESDSDRYRRERKENKGGWVSYKFKYTVTLPPDRCGILKKFKFVD